MSTNGDQELGAALRSLPAPEHGPGFWEELDQRLAGEVPMEAAPPARPRRSRPGGRGCWRRPPLRWWSPPCPSATTAPAPRCGWARRRITFKRS